jgi:hypothetical protein
MPTVFVRIVGASSTRGWLLRTEVANLSLSLELPFVTSANRTTEWLAFPVPIKRAAFVFFRLTNMLLPVTFTGRAKTSIGLDENHRRLHASATTRLSRAEACGRELNSKKLQSTYIPV